jgi:16S rRNA (guanine1207-N2)-methyltransferase
MSEYYAFQEIPVLLRGEPATMVGKPGVWSWSGVDPGTAALIDVMEVHTTDTVLDLGCGTGLIGLAAARLASRGRVTLVDVNVAAVACARRTISTNAVFNADVQLGEGTDVVEGYDLVLSHLPRGRAVVERLIQEAAVALKPGGRFYLVAHKRAGVKGAIAYAKQIMGRAGVVQQRRGYHVALAVKEQVQSSEVSKDFQTLGITLDGVPTELVSQPGVFAWDRLDEGTAALVGAMEVQTGEAVLDLGCGTGLLALAAARRGGRVTAVDADLRAVESARRTLAANGVAGEVLVSDCAQVVIDRRFGVVLCNPPFHQGVGIESDVARQMVRDAATVLRSGGRFYVVSNAFIRYERQMEGRFAGMKEVFSDRRYRVLRATDALDVPCQQ